MDDSFSFKITIMPPDWRAGHPDPPHSSIRKVAVPSAPSETFANVWESLKMRYFALYNESITSRGYFHKLQTSDGCDIAAGIDEVGKLGFGPRSPPEQLQLVMLQNALDREGSIAFDSLMRPKSAKRAAPSDSEVQEAKRRRLQQQQYGAAVEDLQADQPVPSREPESSSQEESGASHSNSRTTTVWQEDSQGFKAPQRIRQAGKRKSAAKKAQPQNHVAENDQHEDQDEAQDEEQQEPQEEAIDEDNVETNLPRQDPYRELSFSPEVPNPLDPATRTPRTRRTASTKGPVSAQTSRSSSRHPLTATRKYKEPPTPVSAEEIASTYSASTTARQPRTGRSNAVATPTLSFTTEPQRQSQPAEDFPNDEDALADSESPIDDLEEDPGYKSTLKKQLEPQQSASIATPKLWTVDEDILLLNNPEKTAVFVSKILKNKLGMFRTSSAVRSRRTLLAEKGVSVKTLSQQSSEQAPKSSQLTDSSPLVAKKSVAAKKPSTQDIRAGFTSVNEVQLPAKQTRAIYRGFSKLGSSAPSSDNASLSVIDKDNAKENGNDKQTTLFSEKGINGKGKEPTKNIRASYAELNARYQSKQREQRDEAVVVSDDDTGHSKASSEYNDARAIEDSQHAAGNKVNPHQRSRDEASEERNTSSAQEMAARAMNQHNNQQEQRQSSVRSSNRAALAGSHDKQTSSAQKLRDRRQPVNKALTSQSDVVMSDDQVSVQDELAQLASHGVDREETSHNSSQEDGDVMSYYDKQASKAKKVVQDSNTDTQNDEAPDDSHDAATKTAHDTADEDLESKSSGSPEVNDTIQEDDLENRLSSDPLTNEAGGRLTRPRPIGHSSILISARPFSQRQASSVMVPETQLDEQSLVQQQSSAESAGEQQNAQEQSFLPQEEPEQEDSEQSSAEDFEETNSQEPSIYSTPQGVSQEEKEVEHDVKKVKKVLDRGVNTEDSSSEYAESGASSDDESDENDAEYHSSSESAGSQQIAKKDASIADEVASSDESSDGDDEVEQAVANGVDQKQSKTALRGSGKSINPFHVHNAHIPRASSSKPKEKPLTLADQLKSAKWSKKPQINEESESDSDDSEDSDES